MITLFIPLIISFCCLYFEEYRFVMSNRNLTFLDLYWAGLDYITYKLTNNK